MRAFVRVIPGEADLPADIFDSENNGVLEGK